MTKETQKLEHEVMAALSRVMEKNKNGPMCCLCVARECFDAVQNVFGNQLVPKPKRKRRGE